MSMEIGKGGAVPAAKAADPSPFTAAETTAASAPEPLVPERAQPTPLPIEHLGPLQEPASAIADLTSAPVEIAFQSVLATASLATQHLRDVETIAGTAPLSLFFLTVAASGERKSSCDRLATSAIQDWEEAHSARYKAQRSEFDIERAAYDQRLRAAVKARSDGDDVIDVPTPLAPKPPVVPRKLLSDITFEGLLRHFEDGDPSIGIFADEGGQFFGGYGMSRDNQLKTAAGLSKLWDAAPLNRTRAGAPQETFRHRRGALHLMIQPGIAETVLANEVLKDQGLFSRLLICWPNSRIGLRLIDPQACEHDKNRAANERVCAFHSRVLVLLKEAPTTEHAPLEVRPKRLDLEPEARALLVDFANQIEVAQVCSGPLAHVSGFASKAAEQSARIAGVLTIFTNKDATHVPLSLMECAVHITEWYVSEAERLMHAGAVTPEIQNAQLVLEFLHDNCANVPIAKRTLVRRGPNKLRDTVKMDKVLNTLEKYGHIRRYDGVREINGSQVQVSWDLVSDV